MPRVYPVRITTTDAILHQIRDLRFHVSVFHNGGSLFDTVKPFTEMHAVTEDCQHFSRVFVAEHEDPDYACVCLLAEMVGI